MSRIWSFLGGVFIGAAGIVTAALVVVKLDPGRVQGEKKVRREPLALPERTNN